MILLLSITFLCLVAKVQSCTVDADCGNTDQPGLCVTGVCQCGVGFSGNQLIDPATCSLTCSPPAIPNAVVFLNEPNVTVSALQGNLVMDVLLTPYLHQTPTTLAFLNPSNGTYCRLMPTVLGQGLWSQAIETTANACNSRYVYSAPFSPTVSQPCWTSLADVTETGAQFAVTYKQFNTQVEVIQQGLAPFGQAASKKRNSTDPMVPVTLAFRRNYTVQVATSFSPNTAPFQVIANGAIRYRLVKIDYNILARKIIVTVQTQTSDAARVFNVQLSGSLSQGISAVVGGPTTGAVCESTSAVGLCDQLHVIEFSDNPCVVSGAEMVLTSEFRCSNGADPSTCGFTNLPANNTYTLRNLLLSYDSCPRVQQYGIDSAKSFLRLHSDVSRAVALTAPAVQGTTIYGRCSIEPSQGSAFQSVTMSSMSVFRVGGNGTNVDLGNQLGATFLTLLSTATQTSPTNPVWDFDLTIDPLFFRLTDVYYLQATLQLTFANTGPLTKRLIMPLSAFTTDANDWRKRGFASTTTTLRSSLTDSVELVAITSRQQPGGGGAPATSSQGVFSQTFRLAAVSSPSGANNAATPTTTAAANGNGAATTTSSSSSSSGTNAAVIGIAVGIVAAVAVVGVIIAAVLIRKRRQRRQLQEAGDAPLTSVTVL